ncbi:MAG: hypothetical protein J07HX5_01343 [halophilic archaeon J07HX5]|jgi:hypothetical protein|nr:MAG: hypothetical protein J07HX5_01343 [halophilic archaeon J07HX5]
MNLAETAEQAARDAVVDVEPGQLRARLETRLAEEPLLPGALTVRVGTAPPRTAKTETGTETQAELKLKPELASRIDPDPGPESLVAQRAAGVQLVSVGLRWTRQLVTEAEWPVETETTPGGRPDAGAEPDPNAGSGPAADTGIDTTVALLGADVAVARGSSLLARTAAVDRAVAVVRTFGRTQTAATDSSDAGGRADSETCSRGQLEQDLLELAVIAGGTVGSEAVTPRLTDLAGELATTLTDETGAFRSPERLRSEVVAEQLRYAASQPDVGSPTD